MGHATYWCYRLIVKQVIFELMKPWYVQMGVLQLNHSSLNEIQRIVGSEQSGTLSFIAILLLKLFRIHPYIVSNFWGHGMITDLQRHPCHKNLAYSKYSYHFTGEFRRKATVHSIIHLFLSPCFQGVPGGTQRQQGG